MAKASIESARISISPDDNRQISPTPVLCREGRGIRHFSCLFYDFCLDKAAKGMWTGFTCTECIHYSRSETEEN